MKKQKNKQAIKASKLAKAKNMQNKIITVKNAEGEPDTKAEILIQNKITYTPKVSVIIPVYNVEEYLRECLDSVVNQTLKEIEIICVDDGSTDNSLEILKEYAKKDSRITVITQQNLHAGVARNAGLAVARGEYLSFLDSDDFFEHNMLEEMHKKVIETKADICICKCSTIDANNIVNERALDFSLQSHLFSKEIISAQDIPNKIFHICQGYPWDKIFKRNFIEKINIKFQSLMNTNDAYFVYTSLCLAERITYLNNRLVYKRHKHEKSLTSNRSKYPYCFISAIEQIKKSLEHHKIFKIVNKSFWEWAISLCIIQLKTLDKDAKYQLFTRLHEKFNEWENIDSSAKGTNRFRAIDYIKKEVNFPVINIAYATDKNFFNLCLVSIVSILKNSVYEDFNFIILHTELTEKEFLQLEELKKIKKFDYQFIYIDENIFKDFPLVWTTKETWYRCSLADKLPTLNKILYLDTDTIVRKSLLPLWQINMSDKLVAAVEDVSLSIEKAETVQLKDNFYFNAGVLLLNTAEWRKRKIFEKIKNYVKKNEVYQADQGTLNILTDGSKIKLSPEYNFMEVWWRNNICQYDKENSIIYKRCDPTIIHFTGPKPTEKKCQNSFKEEFIKYFHMIKQNNIIISLTSYPARINTVNQTIESLLNQTMKADKVILWLAPEQFPNKEKDLPSQLLELKEKGLTIDWYHDIKSYKKLIPTLKKYPDAIIVTADDDNIYQPRWLEKLYNSYLKYPNDIQCHRVTKFYHDFSGFHTIAGGKEYYKDATYLNKLVGLGGVLYPPHCFYKDILNEELIQKLAPTNDDQWFWIQAILNNVKIRVVENPDIAAHYVPGTQTTGLTNINDKGQKLFWKDFRRLTEYYPAAKMKLISESKKYKMEKKDSIPYKTDLQNWYRHVTGQYLNLDNPRTFNEKIQWLKLYDSTPIKTRLADKYLVRDWVKEQIGEQYLIPLLGVYDKFEEIDFAKLPKQFVIKCNHGCGYNIIVKDKSKLNQQEAKEKLDKWMNENFAFKIGYELHYRDIRPKIIIEKFIENKGTDDLYDYKFWCFNGKVEFIQFLSERNLSGLKMAFYDRKWNKQTFVYSHPLDKKTIKKPDNLDEMIQLAEALSKGFPCVRVDFYRLNDGTIYFGEMTFTSASGNCKWNDEHINRALGNMIKLPKLAYNIDTGEYYKLPKKSKLKPWLLLPYNLLKQKYLQEKYQNAQCQSICHQLKSIRIDVKNFGKAENSTNIATAAKVSHPAWFANEQGQGCVAESCGNTEKLAITCRGAGKLRLEFRGSDKRFAGTRFPLWVDYKSIKINGKEQLTAPVATWHDKPYRFEMPVKDGQVINIEVAQQYHQYTKDELKDVILKLNPNSDYIRRNINRLTDKIYDKITVKPAAPRVKKPKAASNQELLTSIAALNARIERLEQENRERQAQLLAAINTLKKS